MAEVQRFEPSGSVVVKKLGKNTTKFRIEWKLDSFQGREPETLYSPSISLDGFPGDWNLWLDRATDDYRSCVFVSARYLPSPQSMTNIDAFKPPKLHIEDITCDLYEDWEHWHNKYACKEDFSLAPSIWKWKAFNNIHQGTESYCGGCDDCDDVSEDIFIVSLSLEGKEGKASPIISKSDVHTLCHDLNKVYKDGWNSDVTLVGDDSVEIKAHKFMLTARSSVFAAMFEHDMSEKQTGTVKIVGMKSDVIQEMLYYMYTDKQPEHIDTMAGSILEAADMYDLQHLKEMCETNLDQKLEVCNVHTTLHKAVTFNCRNLKDRCIKYAIEHIRELKTSAYWKEAKSLLPPEVMFEILEGCIPADKK